MQTITLVLALAVGVPLLARALIRDCEAAQRRAAIRRLSTHAPWVRMVSDWEDFRRKISEAVTPALAEMAQALAAVVEQLRPVAEYAAATDVPAWRRPVTRWWRGHGGWRTKR